MRDEPGGPNSSFEERLKAARGRQGLDASSKPKGPVLDGSAMTGMAIGMRVGIELVSALAVAMVIGYGLDWLFGTKPFLTLLFVPVGGAAGIWNVWRVMTPEDRGKPEDGRIT